MLVRAIQEIEDEPWDPSEPSYSLTETAFVRRNSEKVELNENFVSFTLSGINSVTLSIKTESFALD